MPARSSCRYPAAVLLAALALVPAPLVAGGGASRPARSRGAGLGSQIKGVLLLGLMAGGAGASPAPATGQARPEPAGGVPLRVPEGLFGDRTDSIRRETGSVPTAGELRSLSNRATTAYFEVMFSPVPGLPASLEEAVGPEAGTAPAPEADGPMAGEDPEACLATGVKLALAMALGELGALQVHGDRPDRLREALERLDVQVQAVDQHARTAQAAYERAGSQALAARRSGDRETEIEALDRWTRYGSVAYTLRQILRWHREYPAGILERLQARPAADPPRTQGHREEHREATPRADSNRTLRARPAAASSRGRGAR